MLGNLFFLFHVVSVFAMWAHTPDKERRALNKKVCGEFPEILTCESISGGHLDNNETYQDILKIAEKHGGPVRFLGRIPAIRAGFDGNGKEEAISEIENELAQYEKGRFSSLAYQEKLYRVLKLLAGKYRDTIKSDLKLPKEMQVVPIAAIGDSVLVGVIHKRTNGETSGFASLLIKV